MGGPKELGWTKAGQNKYWGYCLWLVELTFSKRIFTCDEENFTSQEESQKGKEKFFLHFPK